MRSEYAANMELSQSAHLNRDREDWVTAQYVDNAIDMLAQGQSHASVQTMLLNKLVPLYIQRRVLAGQAVRRHKEKATP